MEHVFQTLFDSELLQIRHVRARPSSPPNQSPESDAATHTFLPAADLVLMPTAGLFARHERPKQHFIANPNHAVFLGGGKPFRISFPGGIGDECLILEFSKTALAALLAETVGQQELHSPCLNAHCLLAPITILRRDLLLQLLQNGADPLAIEEISVSMLSASIQAACKDGRNKDRAEHSFTSARRQRQVETVKELIALYPRQEWTLGVLARQANSSPYHLARIFREEVGVPVHRYLIRTRIGKAMELMRAAQADLTRIALDTGFANHSHFTSSFRSLFGMTPSQFRNQIRIG